MPTVPPSKTRNGLAKLSENSAKIRVVFAKLSTKIQLFLFLFLFLFLSLFSNPFLPSVMSTEIPEWQNLCSTIFGWISVGCWVIVSIPRMYFNFKEKKCLLPWR
jgi:hypothetical protein